MILLRNFFGGILDNIFALFFVANIFSILSDIVYVNLVNTIDFVIRLEETFPGYLSDLIFNFLHGIQEYSQIFGVSYYGTFSQVSGQFSYSTPETVKTAWLGFIISLILTMVVAFFISRKTRKIESSVKRRLVNLLALLILTQLFGFFMGLTNLSIRGM